VKRPWYYPRAGESMQQAVRRECLAVRQTVGIMDVSTLGKIDAQGRIVASVPRTGVYTSSWPDLKIRPLRVDLAEGRHIHDAHVCRTARHSRRTACCIDSPARG